MNPMKPQTGAVENKNPFVFRADVTVGDDGKAPSRVMVMHTGEWDDSVKGHLEISKSDLDEYKAHFDAGIGRSGLGADGNKLGLPIDYGHAEWEKAAAWMNGLTIEEDRLRGGYVLIADPVEWTPKGAEAVEGGEFKCISPSFYPRGRGGFVPAEDLSADPIENVLVGAGLTNIPFFSNLAPVKASTLSESDKGDTIMYVKTSVSEKEKSTMSLDELRVKDASALTAEEKAFVEAHKAELSAEEQAKFGLVEASTTPTAPVTANALSDEDAKLLADIRSGAVRVVKDGEVVASQEEINSMKASIESYEAEKAAQIVDAHIARGAIKADSKDSWVGRLTAAKGKDREALETDLKNLPDNEKLKEEIGSAEAGIVASSPREELAKLAAAKVAAAKEAGEALDYSTALKQVASENPELLKADLEGIK